jgi:hypothetical protein
VEEDELDRLRPAPVGQRVALLKEMDETWFDVRKMLERFRQTNFTFSSHKTRFASAPWRKKLIAKERLLLNDIEY